MMIRHGHMSAIFLTLHNGIRHTAILVMIIHHGPMSAIFLTLYNGIHHTAFLVMMINHLPMRSLTLTQYFNTNPSLKWWHLIALAHQERFLTFTMFITMQREAFLFSIVKLSIDCCYNTFQHIFICKTNDLFFKGLSQENMTDWLKDLASDFHD